MRHGAAPADGGVSPAPTWRPDALLPEFECRDLPIEDAPAPDEGDEPLVGTLIRRCDAALRQGAQAVLFVHGWNDYFFHPHVAEFFEQRAIAFHALDLRRYGRSHREGQYRGYVTDLADYAAEIDAAVEIIRATHPTVVLLGHSTGGLIASLYAADHPGTFAGLILNSPWLDMWGPPALTSVLRPLLAQWSRRNPASVLPLPQDGQHVYARALHTSHGGEWEYDLSLKTPGSDPVRVGWLRAILRGHSRVAKGLAIDCPVLVTTSTATAFLLRYSARAREADTVLDVNRIGARAWRLGDTVTLARIEGGTHDLALSPPEARARWFDALDAWLTGYVAD